MEWIILAKDLLPPAQPKPIPGADKVVQPLFEYGLWILAISGGVGVGIGGYKLATTNKGRDCNGLEPFKWMGGGISAVVLAGSLIAIINGVAG
ncbi:hypothetical protein YW3DRAFT_06785 [Streptomyces sp. MnatMP-M77]|uniref:hypothetical protein n=1 Tax=unclassified Streptomyces TaxID=2593676 RepID=UPI000804DFED|nr:hypothetical protein [Streptomyces sp. MnatMP-M77]MYT82493.1 hypothetical protein [Streptomyces sp. SID8364]SBV02501.1 hypothetical protein YW3DRAFT_06785 [Streptomyces sp. MnatMP-M77]